MIDATTEEENNHGEPIAAEVEVIDPSENDGAGDHDTDPETETVVETAAASGVDAAIIEAFEKELVEARKLADEKHDLYLRAEADLQTLRRVGETRRRESIDRVRRDLLTSFLEIADDLEKALEFGDAESEQLMAGVETTMRAFRHIFEREGVKRIDAEDAAFDPELHEAVGVVPMPGVEEERVISVERSGYTIGEELLRAARVIVGRPPDEG